MAAIAEMLVADRIGLKIWLEGQTKYERETIKKIFHGWIQRESVGELLIDVHDYSHVPDGPGVMLIAHEAHYRMDTTDGRLGLKYARKRGLSGDFNARLATVFYETLLAAETLESDPESGEKFRFDTSSVVISIDDRLTTPNSPETFSNLEPSIRTFAENLFGGKVVITPESEPKSTFAVTISDYGQPSLSDLLGRLNK